MHENRKFLSDAKCEAGHLVRELGRFVNLASNTAACPRRRITLLLSVSAVA
jgi:hypothetical protein